ncbi:tetratricopeptide repeat protein [Tenggerimyces flavus]|uniref:DnaJ domain-containing protein n=1 Tax=Tenggerimyces flavus TaxID=1708749 RepID=A0ABV7YF99_9ACTN|nr:DnaJ domain-containing protein [Tenggerimyces flavus]MBM7787865.1 curved DNA-binding protein CbpA [Tenggerimyces flavus]
MADYYELLSVSRTATSEEIRAAITGQRRIWVRRQSSPDLERRAEAEQRVRDIDAAERTLLNAERRREYDQQFQPSEQPPEPAEPAWPPPENEPPSKPRSLVWDRLDDTEDHLWRGEDYLDAGKWDFAIAEFEYVLERSSDGVDRLKARRGLAAVASASGRIEEFLRPLEKAVTDKPHDDEAKQTLVKALYDSAIVVLSYGPAIQTKRQWRILSDRLRRIKRLRLKDPRTKLLTKQLQEIRTGARRARWHVTIMPSWYVGLAVVALVPSFLFRGLFGYALSALLLILIGVVWVIRHRTFGWKKKPTRNRAKYTTPSAPSSMPLYPYDGI